MTELRAAHLTLRPISEADATFMLELLNDPGWIANIGDRGVRDMEAARDYITERFAPNGWFVACAVDGEPLGICGLLEREGLSAPDLGYAFLQRHSGKGYATEAAGAVLRHARETLGLKQVVAITALGNTASQRVLEKIGLTRAGLVDLPGSDEPSALFTS